MHIALRPEQLELRASGVAQERDRWMTRVEMAREEGETELEQVASARLDDLTAQLRQVGERLEALQRRRDAIRRAVAAMSSRARASAADAAGVAPPPSATGDAWEARFRELEMKRELGRLRRRSESAGETE